MRKTLPLLLSLGLILGFSASDASAQDALVNLPGLTVDTSNGGATVSMPSLNVDTHRGTTVNAPGVNIQTGGHGRGTRVQAPGVNVQTNAYPARTNVQAPPQIRGVVGNGMSYMNADLVGKDFRNKYLVGANFTNANLTNTDFSGADLRGAIFLNTDLTNTNFTRANMISTDFTNASFIRTNLSNADMSRANLTNASVEDALATNTRFDGAILTNVDMSLFVRQHAQAPVAPPAPTAPQARVQAPVAPPAPAQAPTARPDLTKAQTISTALKMDPKKPKEAKRIDLTINFALDSDMLSDAGMRQIAEIATALLAPKIRGSRIVLEGHTDNTGNDAYNQELSYRRAMRVLFTLRDQHKIPGALLTAKGFGETRPIANNKSDMGRTMNRRVTIVNLGK